MKNMNLNTLAKNHKFWFINTDIRSFIKAKAHATDDNPFRYWLKNKRLYVTPPLAAPLSKYDNELKRIQPGDYVFAYESKFGFVAVGRVSSHKDLRTDPGGEGLYKKQEQIVVRSIAVDWDDSIRRSLKETKTSHFMGTFYEIPEGSPKYHDALELFQEFEQKQRNAKIPSEAQQMEQINANPSYDNKTREQIIQARVGQGAFRRAVLLREPICRLTKIGNPSHLVASHIKPWAACEHLEHTDGNNGIMLAPHIDHLFDSGQISFEDNGDLLLASWLDRSVLHAWNIPEIANVGAFSANQARYLAYHRKNVFERKNSRNCRNLIGDCDTLNL